MDFTSLVRKSFIRRADRMDRWVLDGDDVQRKSLKNLLKLAKPTEIAQKYEFDTIRDYNTFAQRLPVVEYEDIRADVMRMINGEKDVLWRGVCKSFAQSSGTTGGKSKYIPITDDSLKLNHYRGASDAVAQYLRLVAKSRLFSGKGLILGGSFANELPESVAKDVKVGDLSATLIDRINPIVNRFRVPSKEIALMDDWSKKLPALINSSVNEDITNLSGVPSWFLTLLNKILETTGKSCIHDIWPNLEVFFHGGISFEPYRQEYQRITDQSKMHFLETYNASEGFFATQTMFEDPSMILILDRGVFYEFAPLLKDGSLGDPVPLWEVKQHQNYALIISAANGLWRYSIGDVVKICSLYPLKIVITGRTKAFINAFGEELMADNAEKAIAAACKKCNAAVADYTVAPVYAADGKRGRHQWLIEWLRTPENLEQFAVVLDHELQQLNSDYQAKRSDSIFLDLPQITTARSGLFDDWLKTYGSGKLGGQRKVPRLSNTRQIIDSMLSL